MENKFSARICLSEFYDKHFVAWLQSKFDYELSPKGKWMTIGGLDEWTAEAIMAQAYEQEVGRYVYSLIISHNPQI